MKRLSCLFILMVVVCNHVNAQSFITAQPAANGVTIVGGSQIASIYVDPADDWLVKRSAEMLQTDIQKVTGKKPAIVHKLPAGIIIGSTGRSSAIKQLVTARKIKAEQLSNKWEAYLLQTVNNAGAGMSSALVIAGSDRRGTAFGVMELCKQIGVSPWVWWADVPPAERSNLYVKGNTFITDAPKVKYRGIFINDEAPALSGWTKEKFGGFNHLFYEKVFELMIRLKSNYLWPAMWGNAFYDDDSLNIQTADNYGIVIGTSHHEPLMRAHDEWRRYGTGKWNYDSNETKLKEFWRGGMQRTGTTEKIVSVGMRGDGDMAMTQGTAIPLLERIVKDQRTIIEEVTGKPASETPQLWALYKEVQDYYDKGMRVPDDVTLLLCDDNWGNIRRLPKLDEKPRKGGYGIYYHFDYVGGPRNYKWINTNNIARVWEQMHMAWQYKAREIWIVNVGDIKPMELPISFFLDYAWDPERIKAEDLPAYHDHWAEQQFGKKHARHISSLLQKFGQYSSRRKPELLAHDTYSRREGEWDYVMEEHMKPLRTLAEATNNKLPSAHRDAYFQLVLHPIRALDNLYSMYHMVALNHYNADERNIIANTYADSVKYYYIQDSLITKDYHQLAGGKWNHMMSQTHIGYTYWQQPPAQKMPTIKFVDKDSAVTGSAMLALDAMNSRSSVPPQQKGKAFYQWDSRVSMEAAHYTRAISSGSIQWKIIPGIGRTGDGITTWPVTAPAIVPAAGSPHIEYDVYVWNKGKVNMQTYFSPTLNYHNLPDGLQYAIAIDDETPQIVSVNKEDNSVRSWEKWVANNIILKTSSHEVKYAGKHVVKVWLLNPGLILQKVVLDFSVPGNTYLGYWETKAD